MALQKFADSLDFFLLKWTISFISQKQAIAGWLAFPDFAAGLGGRVQPPSIRCALCKNGSIAGWPDLVTW
jgi:hypothetical protein